MLLAGQDDVGVGLVGGEGTDAVTEGLANFASDSSSLSERASTSVQAMTAWPQVRPRAAGT